MNFIKLPTANTVIAIVSAMAMLYLLLSLSGTVSLPRATEQPSQQQRPAYYLNGVQNHNFDNNGELSVYITGDAVSHQPTKDSSIIHNPQLDLFTAGVKTWQATAASATAYSHSDLIELHDSVDIRTADGNTLLTTERLDIVADKKIAKTQSPVSLVTAGGVITSGGMQADLRSKEIVMTGNIRGHYDAPL
ncbi:MAG: lipopolysaccharide export system protein LptC [Paraglaciecola psychrophila]|jgi:lipopolysaccharide export system protein LptC